MLVITKKENMYDSDIPVAIVRNTEAANRYIAADAANNGKQTIYDTYELPYYPDGIHQILFGKEE